MASALARSSCQTIGGYWPQLKEGEIQKLTRRTAPDDLHFSSLVRRFVASSGHGLPLVKKGFDHRAIEPDTNCRDYDRRQG